MQNKNKIALFDFCETLANFQTADEYVNYVRKQTDSKSMKVKESIRLILKRARVIKVFELIFKEASINKRIVLWQLRGVNYSILDQLAKSYYYNVIKKNLIKEVVAEMQQLQNNGWRIVIVSAGYEIYLKYFCDDFLISQNDLISVKIKFSDNKCLGTFDGGDRLWDKTKKLDERFDKSNITSKAFSDSISDLPLLKWADEGYVIRRSTSDCWNKLYNFKEITW